MRPGCRSPPRVPPRTQRRDRQVRGAGCMGPGRHRRRAASASVVKRPPGVGTGSSRTVGSAATNHLDAISESPGKSSTTVESANRSAARTEATLPSRADVQTAVDQLAAALGLSVLVEDRARQLPVWWNTQGEVDRVRQSTILDRNVDPSVAAVIRQFRLDRATAPVRTPEMPENGMWARWCVPVRHEGHLLGYLWVLDPDGTVTDADLPRLVECAELAGRVLAAHRQNTGESRWRRKELLDRLLDRPDPDAARELTRLELLPHGVRVQVDASRQWGGWELLPGNLRAHVATEPPQPATSGAPLPLVELGEAVRWLTHGCGGRVRGTTLTRNRYLRGTLPPDGRPRRIHQLGRPARRAAFCVDRGRQRFRCAVRNRQPARSDIPLR
jgi:hypothetical protein